MGRPIDGKFFGDPALSGSQLEVTFGALATAGWIMKQKGSNRFRCTDDGTTTIEDCILSVDAPVAGTCNILVGGNLVSKLTAHRATTVDSSGNVVSVPWTDADLADAVVLSAKIEEKPKPKAKSKPKQEKQESSFFSKSKYKD